MKYLSILKMKKKSQRTCRKDQYQRISSVWWFGWLDRWKNNFIHKYKLDEIYNAGEFGLFFRMQPNKLLNLQSEACTGRKRSKIRLTGMAAANAVGDKIVMMFVIGKSKSPRWFKRTKHSTPCRYRNQNKSWMDSVLLEEWIHEMDTNFTKEEKSSAL